MAALIALPVVRSWTVRDGRATPGNPGSWHDALIADNNLPALTRYVGMAVARHNLSRSSGEPLSLHAIGSRLGLTPLAVQDKVRELVTAGWLTVRSGRYDVAFPGDGV